MHPASLRLPAILDIGCNHNLVIRRDHLTAWSALHPDGLRQLRRTRIHGRVGVEAAANVWVHANRPYRRDDLAGKPPYLLECPEGIVVTPGAPDDDYPRLPILGLRALRWAKLQVHIDCRTCRLTMRTARWFGLFG